MTPALDAIGRLGEAKSLLAAAARAGVAGLDDSALVLAASTAEELGRLVDALRVQLAGEIDERSRYELGRDGLAQRLGETRAVHLIEKVTLVSSREAARRVRLGRATRARFALDGSPLPAGFDRDQERIAAASAGGVRPAATLADAAGRDIVVTSLPDDKVLAAVAL